MKKQYILKNNRFVIQNCISKTKNFNKIKNLLFILLFIPVFALSQSPNQNWIKTKSYKIPTLTSIGTPTISQASTQVSYSDGLGRPIQQIDHQQSNSGKDIITHFEYDVNGREEKEFLSYANQSASLNYNSSANTDVISFYNTIPYENTSNPYSQKQFEASQLNRVFKESFPGSTWIMGSGNEIEYDYQANISNELKKYTVTTTWNTNSVLYDVLLNDLGNYAPNQLYKSIIKDENWVSGKDNTTEEFKNNDGQVVLRRKYDNSVPHDTYYVYDVFNNLTFVIPPDVSGTITPTILDNMCYQYKYDGRNRLVEKKLPGKQWEYLVYDKLDRVVATGPAYNPYGAIAEINKGWMLTKYDILNRPVYTAWHNALVSGTLDRKALQIIFNNATIISESKTTSATNIDGISAKYTNQVNPTTFTLLSINYYDNYDYPNALVIPSQIEGQNTTTIVKGLPTGGWVRVLDAVGSTAGELNHIVYDTRYRVLRIYTKNYLGGYTQVDSKLDWAGKAEYTLSKHKRDINSSEFVLKQRFTYSAQDRLVKHTHEIVGFLSEELITLNTYNELGELISKKVGGDRSGSSPLQKIDFTYNIRGWLQGINNINNLNPSATENDLFAFQINYNSPVTATPLYNGNISETFWRTSADNVKRKYAYKYDKLNRLLEANYNKPDVTGTLDNYLEKLTYDKGGNILTLERNGNLDPSGGVTVNLIDNLVYTYDTNKKNELKKVNDLSNSPQGFNQDSDIASGDVDQNIEDHTNDYTYDFNGNMKTDTNKGIVLIYYNQLNLPTYIKFDGTTKGAITYIYNAIGQKVKKVVYDDDAHTTTTTDYLSGFQYQNATLQFFPHAEGYVHYTKPLASQGGANSALGSFNYVFNYNDHLGNVRVSFAKDPLDGNAVKILEENNYYAFGLKHKNYNIDHLDFNHFPGTGVEIVPAPAVANASYNYKYNDKELQEELGLNMYDYGARNYDPSIGRWMNIDPLAETSRRFSPYAYALNNPVFYIDPDGMQAAEFDEFDGVEGWGLDKDGKWIHSSEITEDNYKDKGYSHFAVDGSIVSDSWISYENGDTGPKADLYLGFNQEDFHYIEVKSDAEIQELKELIDYQDASYDAEETSYAVLVATAFIDFTVADALIPDPSDLAGPKWIAYAVGDIIAIGILTYAGTSDSMSQPDTTTDGQSDSMSRKKEKSSDSEYSTEAEHTSNQSPSNRPTHEKGLARKGRDKGGEKGDKRRTRYK